MGINTDKLIYCQKDIPKSKWRYGFRSSAATGCGWIAVYNALRLMGYTPSPKKLINYFEKQIPFFNGNTGTFILSPAIFFKNAGFEVKISARRSDFDKIGAESDVCVLYYRWKSGLKIGSHFVAVEKTAEGFTGYNTYRNSSGPDRYGKSLEDFLKRKGYFCAVLTGIKNSRIY